MFSDTFTDNTQNATTIFEILADLPWLKYINVQWQQFNGELALTKGFPKLEELYLYNNEYLDKVTISRCLLDSKNTIFVGINKIDYQEIENISEYSFMAPDYNSEGEDSNNDA